MPDEPLPPEERDALDRLPREAAPPPHLEDRVVAALRRAGHLPPRRGPSAWRRLAAGVALLIAGVAIGRLTTASPDASSEPGYLLLLYGGRASVDDEPARFAEYAAWAGSLADRAALVAAERLAPAARTIGPSPAADVQPVGFFLIRADNLDSAAAIAGSCPHLKYGGTVIVRPIG
jgi:hypothetical protein